MSVHKIDGKTPTVDRRVERIGLGTMGGEHIVKRGVQSGAVAAVVDNSDSNIEYGIATGYSGSGLFTADATLDWVSGGTLTVIGGTASPGSAGSAANYSFRGTSIAVLGSLNEFSGNMRVYIDGEETKGRIPTYTGIKITGSPTNPVITADQTTIPALAGAASFSSTGIIYLNGELITYSSRDANGFYGCSRGDYDTVATEHNADETIYQWASIMSCYQSTGSATKQLLYYNPLLDKGDHDITIVAETNSTSGYASVYFDGFITNPILGSKSILTQLATFTNTFTTDANGHCDIGGIIATNNDVTRLAFVGYTQTNCESTNTTIMGKLGVKYVLGQPYYYYHNGPISATVTVIMTFAFIGESI